MRIKLLLCFIVGINLQSTLAKSQQVTISGTIDSSLIKAYGCHELTIRKKYRLSDRNLKDVITVALKPNGTFDVNLPGISDLTYLTFEMFGKRENRFLNLALTTHTSSRLEPAFIFNPSDSITMEIRGNGFINFKGKGSKKMECQMQMYNFVQSYPQTSRQSTLTTSKRMLESLEMVRKLCELNEQIHAIILNTYKTEISEEAFQLIKADSEFWCDYMFLSNLYFTCYNKPAVLAVSAAQTCFQNYLNNHSNVSDSMVVSKSLYYPELLFEIEWNRLKLYSKTGSYNTGDSFEQMYETIKNKYSGALRDRLTLICFQKLDTSFPSAAKTHVTEALKMMMEPDSKRLLSVWYETKYSTFAFKLEDAGGNIHKLGDFAGKIVILDFWYTGCSWCARLNESMKPVYDKYAGNKNVVFITVNVDQKKERWLNSVKGGLYTSSHSLNLHTGNLGRAHPIIQHYNIVGYPTQIIIDQYGNIASANPPRLDLNPEIPQPNAKVVNGLTYNNYFPFTKLIDDLLMENN